MSADAPEKYSVVKIAMNLFVACLVSGLLIACVNYFTADIAAQKALELKNEAMRQLIAEADTFEPVKEKKSWVKASVKGTLLGYIVPSESKGYGGVLRLLVAVSPEGKVLNFSILENKETPGLGDKAGQDPFKGQFFGKKASDLEVTKDPSDKNHVQAISGATITSKGVTLGIKKAVESVASYMKDQSL